MIADVIVGCCHWLLQLRIVPMAPIRHGTQFLELHLQWQRQRCTFKAPEPLGGQKFDMLRAGQFFEVSEWSLNGFLVLSWMLAQRLLNQVEDSSWNSREWQCPVGKSPKTLSKTVSKTLSKTFQNHPEPVIFFPKPLPKAFQTLHQTFQKCWFRAPFTPWASGSASQRWPCFTAAPWKLGTSASSGGPLGRYLMW